MQQRIPPDWTIQRSTPFFTRDNVPAALLRHHNTAEGVFGQICVMAGTLTYYGFPDENTHKPEQVLTVKAGEFINSPPQYWHKVELSEDAQFNVNFWSDPQGRKGRLLNTASSSAGSIDPKA